MVKIIPIVKIPEKVLRKKAKEVGPKEILSPKIHGLILNMKETLRKTPSGVGLAAPQVGESLRIFIVSEEAEEIDRLEREKKTQKARPELLSETKEEAKEKQKQEWKYYVFVNPIIKKIAKKKLQGPEGCLSVPEKFGLVKRGEKITVQAYDERGQKFTRGFARFFARVIQHELDHLEGTLFIDKADKMFESSFLGKSSNG